MSIFRLFALLGITGIAASIGGVGFSWGDNTLEKMLLTTDASQRVVMVLSVQGEGVDPVLSVDPANEAPGGQQQWITIQLPNSRIAPESQVLDAVTQNLGQWQQSVPELKALTAKNAAGEVHIQLLVEGNVQPAMLENQGTEMTVALKGAHWLNVQPTLPPDTIMQTDDGPGFVLDMVELDNTIPSGLR